MPPRATAPLLLSAALAAMSSACSTPSLTPTAPPMPPPPALCLVLCPPMPAQTTPNTISRHDLHSLRAWGSDCQTRQAECIGWISNLPGNGR